MATPLGVIGALQHGLATRRISAQEMVRFALERITRLDPPLNAVVALRSEEAMADARDLDRRLAAGETPGPLAGVPVLVKDLEDVAGMITTQGSVLFRDSPPAQVDGLVPSRLRAAGAIVVGKSNLPEFACEGFTANLLFGVTRNPWATDWSPGGSSGGSAAAISAGMVPVATATDGGGSIRIPAAFCGLVGLKATSGVIARRPIPDWIDYSTDGPLATTVADLRLLMDVESGPEPGDPNAWPRLSPTPLPARLRMLAAPRLQAGPQLGPSLASTFDAAVARAEKVFGSAAERVDASSLWAPGATELDWVTVTATEHVHRLSREFAIAHLDRMHASGRAFMEFGLGVSIQDYMAARRRRFEYVAALDRMLGDDAILITPTVCSEGFLADGRLSAGDEPGSVPSDVYNTGLMNMTGHPALSVPAGISPNGVPFGLQIVAPRFRDSWLMDLAARWEAVHPWPRHAPGFDSFESALGL